MTREIIEMSKRKRSKNIRETAAASRPKTPPFLLRATDQIGANAAEDDAEYLADCFVDTGDLDLLLDLGDRRQIVLGRTGTGKSALLAEICRIKNEQAIEISPESLALTYVSNSTILSFFADLGVNLEPFYKLLWRHVLTVEVLSRYFQDHVNLAGSSQNNLFQWIRGLFSGDNRKDRDMREAVQYIERWGANFWLETEYRVHEITETVETQLNAEFKAQLGADVLSVAAGGIGGENVSEETKAEVIQRAQRVVSAAQVQDLTKVINLLDRILSDRQKAYYIVIDKLDENWVEDRIRFDLIMALIQTARDFMKVKNAKVVIAIRRDLLERVFRLSRSSGFQEEKYQSLYLPIVWEKADLIGLLDRRIRELVTKRHGPAGFTHRDILPRSIRNTPVDRYFVERAPRPRDVISFFNCCIASGAGRAKLGVSELAIAEGEYSRSRLRALGDEWSADIPDLLEFLAPLQKKPPSFKLGNINDEITTEFCLKICSDNPKRQGEIKHAAFAVVECDSAPCEFRRKWAHWLYKIGLVGLKVESFEAESWVDELGRGISGADIDDTTSIVVHPAYHRALGIRG